MAPETESVRIVGALGPTLSFGCSSNPDEVPIVSVDLELSRHLTDTEMRLLRGWAEQDRTSDHHVVFLPAARNESQRVAIKTAADNLSGLIEALDENLDKTPGFAKRADELVEHYRVEVEAVLRRVNERPR